jgi:hypothetical protein
MRPCKGPDIWKNTAGHHPLATLEAQGLRWRLWQPTAAAAAVVVSAAAKMAAGLGEELGVSKMWMTETETHSWAVVLCPVSPEESFGWDPHPRDCTSMHCAS